MEQAFLRPMALGKGGIVWLTGLSGSGKSTIAHALCRTIREMGRGCCILDGDVLRQGLCSDLGFSPEDRAENVRRVGHVASLMAASGFVVITALISPYREGRQVARDAANEQSFFEIHVATPIHVCEARDIKGLYRAARSGEISQFTGVSAPYEEPLKPNLVLNTAVQTLDSCISKLVDLLRGAEIL